MTKIEQAYRTLDLKPGASIKEIVEARDDLLLLWDPDRLKSHPRLRSKAQVKIREIHRAYQLLMQDPGQGEGVTETEAPGNLSPAAAAASATDAPGDVSVQPVSGSASLFDEVFRDRKAEKRRRLPMGPILAGAVVVLSAVVILLLIGGGDSPQEPDRTSVADPAPAPPAPPEPDAPPVESGAQTSTASVAVQDAESGASKAPAVSTPPPQRAIATPPQEPAPAPAEPAVAPPPKAEKPKPARPPRPGDRPVLVREPEGGEPAATAPPAPDPKAAAKEAERKAAEKRQLEEAEKAYRDLVSGSKAAKRLVEGQVPSLRFTEWSIAGRRGSEILVDLVAEQFAGQPVHFVWSVDTSTGKVRALSQAARDLEQAVAEE